MMRVDAELALYAGAGTRLLQYGVDTGAGTLEMRGCADLPAGVQYAWPHPRLPFLYVACSNGSPGVLGDTHYAVTLRIDTATGALRPHGEPVSLPSRPIHITVDERGEHALIAYNDPSGLTVHQIGDDGPLDSNVRQAAPLDVGIFAHQVRVTRSDRTVILVTRGNDARKGRPEDPGALKVYDYRDGQLANRATVAPNGGHGFGPRHLDFHPTQPWIYVSLERQNRIHTYYAEEGVPEPAPRFVTATLAEPQNERPEQRAGTIHVHPRGHVVYVANRAHERKSMNGRKVFAGGESNIGVYAVDDRTGEPCAIQHIDTRGFVPRTFSIDPGGRLLVVGNSETFAVETEGRVEDVQPNLALFRISDDGSLTYIQTYTVDTGGATLFWTGLMRVPS